MARVTVHHLTRLARLPLIEEQGLRTRADLSEYFGELGPLDRAAPGTFAHGKRVSAYLDPDYAAGTTGEHGPGLVTYTVDPAKTLAAPASRRDDDPEAYWAEARPLAAWQAQGAPPDDLDVHVNVPVRVKYLELRAPLLDDDELGDYAPVVAELADDDRLSAKALMHLAIIACDGDFASSEFRAACALAWRDEPDPAGLVDELVQLDADKVASAALAAVNPLAPAAAERLRATLEATRDWAGENGLEPGRALFARTALVLENLPAAVAADEERPPTA